MSAPKAGWFYDFAKVVTRLIGTAVWRLSVEGAEHVPATGPVIIACNHVSNLDPPMLGCVCPRAITYMAKEELFRIPVLGPVITALNAFPVDRKRGVAALREGRALGIFPEGGRNRTGVRAEAQQGVGLMIKLAGGATVVPAYIDGTRHAKRLHSIHVRFGDPIRFDPGQKASRDDVAKWTAEIMTRIYALRGADGR